MAFCFAELNLWSSRSSLNVQDTDIGTFQFYEKGDSVFPADQHYYSEKQHFTETRGYPWFLSNRRPERLRDALKELEELLQSNSCVCTKWRTKHCCQMLLSSGVLVTLTLSGVQLERVGIDKTLVGRLPAETISHAVIGERFLLLSLAEKSQVCQVYLGRRSQSSPELSAWRPEKLSAADIKVLSSIHTGGEPLDCCFSLTQPYQILTVELHKEAHSSTAELRDDQIHSTIGMHEEVHVTQTCVYECARGRLQHLSATTVSLSSVPVSWCRDPSERWLLLGLQDSSVVLVHIETGLQTCVTCPMLPSLLVWHPDGGLIVVAGGQGELQCFDLGLSPLQLQLVSEEDVVGTSGKSLQLARHVRISSGLEGLEWAHSPGSQGAEGLEVHNLLMLRFHRGPVAAMRLRLGVLNGGQLGAGELLQHRLRCGEVDAALSILGNMDWCMMGADCYRGLISVTDHLLRKPLDEQTEAQLEAALGMFYSPSRDLTDTVILEYRKPISRYARRFFHHLLRHQRFEKAFLLALDIGARDLFMDLHFVARDRGELVLANVARRKAEELDAEAEPKPQKDVSVTPVSTHTEWTNPSKAHRNTRVDSKGKMDKEMEEDFSETPINPAILSWTQTELTLTGRDAQVPKDSEQLKVIHLGSV
ncbi:WD repeat-containing and planar cell polarity effector protein fritz homolog isoform X3 [Tachysurus fulvidraco]|uniref:WD repeat-containing and planar cell polarity effector protein fritz homolog isoform X3 n=1 Tax=Tachysurus fulvidraco TaxID=1234273 RepID=UPI001FEF8CFF|nr:WD repeat-containing and planar cell polarity effector protein fritz homolog isoform X3 [Tachysurus fulvidraco]